MELDLYEEGGVLRFLSVPSNPISSFGLKRFAFLGDRVSATILVNVAEQQMSRPEIALGIVRILQMAFPDGWKDPRLCTMPYLSIHLLKKLIALVEDDGCIEACRSDRKSVV